jgi:Delta3-Delta2-enoyl-CoA isomerase
VSGLAASTLAVERAGDVTLLRLTDGENRFRPDSLAAIEAALGEVAAAEGPGALVVTGEGKFFSNGLDLDWMGTAGRAGLSSAEDVVARVHALLARILAFPTVTVAAVNGHAFAAGAMLALACDLRVMRADRGFVCLPEVDIGIPFTPGMTALLRTRLSPATATEAMVFGKRYGGHDALAAGLVDEVADEQRVVAAAVERAAALAAKPRATVQAIKRGLYADALAALEAPASLEAPR